MTEARNVRASETRDSVRSEQSRPDATWSPPALLDAPKARPGYVQRWITTSILGKETQDNVYKRMREGWTPRPADTVKDDSLFSTINHGQWAGSIGVEGMLLCEMPIEKKEAQRAYYEGRNAEQNESVVGELDALGRNNGQPIFQERKSSSSRGRPSSAMDD